MTGKQKKLDEEANKVFALFLEAILAYHQGTQYSTGDSIIMFQVECMIDELVGANPIQIDNFRKKLAEFYFEVERQTGVGYGRGTARWDSHPQIRDAILKHMKMNLDDYLVAMGLKHHRSIDDPWEPK
jgi:hypothetical protein